VPMILTRDTKLAAGIKCRAPNGQALDGGQRQQRRVKAKAQRTAAAESEISMHDD